MIYYYKHKYTSELSQEEFDLLGEQGLLNFALQNGLDPEEIRKYIDNIEVARKQNKEPYDLNEPNIKRLCNKAIDEYIDYFNKNAQCEKQAYVVIGNISSGKTTYANLIEQDTHSIIVDSDRIKTGEVTPNGFYEGLSSLYSPEKRDKIQLSCTNVSGRVLEVVTKYGMNLILPTSAKTTAQFDARLQKLTENNYDIHLIIVESPIEECANRNMNRFLIKEFAGAKYPNGLIEHGRYVPKTTVGFLGDTSYDVFATSYKRKKYKSYLALYNDKTTNNEEIDLETMSMPSQEI